MNLIDSGNLDELVAMHPETNGWIAGHFMDPSSFLHSDEVEIKWAIHRKGDVKKGAIASVTTKTVCILMRGQCVIRFPELDREVTLCKLGDYLTYDAGQVMHEFKALEDTTVIAVRWPSKRP